MMRHGSVKAAAFYAARRGHRHRRGLPVLLRDPHRRCKSGTALFEVDYWPKQCRFANYVAVLTTGTFPRNIAAIRCSSPTIVVALLAAPRRHRRLRAGAHPLPRRARSCS